jgi:hypothetical protein
MPRFRDQLRSVRVRPWQRLWQPWAPTNEERDKWVALAGMLYARTLFDYTGMTDEERQAYVTSKLRDEAMEAGVGPMTWLWIASMVVQLVRLWREWKRDTK